MRPLIPGIESTGHSYSWDKRQAKLYRLILTRPQAIATVAIVFFLRGNISRIKNPHMPMPNSR